MAPLNFFGGFNSFVPQATGQVISFIRDPKKYRLNQYAQLVPSPKDIGVYYRLGVDQPVRVVNDQENVWEDGKKRPEQHENQLKFDTVEFQTVRRDYGYTIGWKTVEQADVKVMVAHLGMAQNQCMVGRTHRAISLLENPSNWGGNTDTANNLNSGAGFWDKASSDPTDPNYLAIKKSFDELARRITLLTNGMVDVEEEGTLRMLLSPGAALKISQSSEIHDYLSHSPFAMAQVKGKVPGQNAKWGLPDQLYGWDIVIETAVVVSQRPNANDAIGSEASIAGGNPARHFIKNDDSAVALSRIGGLDGQYGAPSFSTLQIYYVGKELEIENFDEPKHRRSEGHVVEDVKEVLAAPASGFLVQNILS
jgi:hypothetical protein